MAEAFSYYLDRLGGMPPNGEVQVAPLLLIAYGFVEPKSFHLLYR